MNLEFIKKEYKKLIIILILVVSIIFLIIADKNNIQDIEITKNELNEENKIEEVINNKIKLDIKGAVNNPGVYELDNNTRVVDVIFKAGGLTEDANTTLLNLSKTVFDEMVIIIYTNNEIETFKHSQLTESNLNIEKKNDNNVIEYIYLQNECSCPNTINNACNECNKIITNLVKEEIKSTEMNSTNNEPSKSSLISLNNATLEQLMSLSGIGESKANAIISYRNEIGKYTNIEQIKNVSGIGDAAFDKIKNNITL
ncbi:MAG: helix-hairpin-helix domain-containing protein [Bacilli bacterium]